MPDLVIRDGSVITITSPPPNTVTVTPPGANPVVLVPVAGLQGRQGDPGVDGATTLPGVIDCGDPNDTNGA